jgi:hypothetical protein
MSGKTNPVHDLLNTPKNDEKYRVMPIKLNKNIPEQFPLDSTNDSNNNTDSFLDGLYDKERSLIEEKSEEKSENSEKRVVRQNIKNDVLIKHVVLTKNTNRIKTKNITNNYIENHHNIITPLNISIRTADET